MPIVRSHRRMQRCGSEKDGAKHALLGVHALREFYFLMGMPVAVYLVLRRFLVPAKIAKLDAARWLLHRLPLSAELLFNLDGSHGLSLRHNCSEPDDPCGVGPTPV